MVRQGAISDAAWVLIRPVLPSSEGRRGRPFSDLRRALEGIAWRFRTGTPWRDVPAEFGPWSTLWCLHDRFSHDGTYDAILAAVQGDAEAAGELGWVTSVDSSVMRAHQHAAGARDRSEGQIRSRWHTGGPVELHEVRNRAPVRA